MIQIFVVVVTVLTDEVGALVFDIGSYSFRAGYAGEDTPKVRQSRVRITKGKTVEGKSPKVRRPRIRVTRGKRERRTQGKIRTKIHQG